MTRAKPWVRCSQAALAALALLACTGCSAALAVWAVEELREDSKITWSGRVTEGRKDDALAGITHGAALTDAAVLITYWRDDGQLASAAESGGKEQQDTTTQTYNTVTSADGRFSAKVRWYKDARYSLTVISGMQQCLPVEYQDQYVPKVDQQVEITFLPPGSASQVSAH
jgi:hypothetical protein